MMIKVRPSGTAVDRSDVTLKFDQHDSVATRISITGEIDQSTACQVQKAVIQALRQQRPASIQVNLEGVSFLDSAGIRALVLSHADAEQVDCRLTVVNARPMVRQVLDIAGLLDHFGIPPADDDSAPAPAEPARKRPADGPHAQRVDLGRC
jgi:anti-anti-sigma factor